jgi:hypothetical protein
MESLGEDINQLRRGRDLDQLQLSVSSYFMSKMLEDVNVLGSSPSADDVVSPLDARSVILVHWCGRLLSEARHRNSVSAIDAE